MATSTGLKQWGLREHSLLTYSELINFLKMVGTFKPHSTYELKNLLITGAKMHQLYQHVQSISRLTAVVSLLNTFHR